MKKITMRQALADLRDRFPEQRRLYAPGCAGEAQIFVNAFQADPTLAENTTFAGVWIPGVNKIDYAALHPSSKAETIFLCQALRAGFNAGRTTLRPLPYTDAFPWLQKADFDAALIHVSPPDENGDCSLGVAADFTPAVWARTDVLKIGLINEEMPAIANCPKISLDAFNVVVEEPSPLLQYPAPDTVTGTYEKIAANVAAAIPDGATVQLGLGSLQFAVLRALSGHRDLRIHSGMISDPLLDAVAAGAIASERDAITIGVALGSDKLYEFAANDGRLRFEPVSYTHNIQVLSQIPSFFAINSIIEIDLFGQANAEYFNGNQASSTGGLVDFLRGAALSDGGMGIVALPSTAKGGSISRIVPKLTAPTTSIARADVSLVGTENGVVDLRGASLDERAEALISIADPTHQADLQNAWRQLRQV
ncbi:MAG: acetyl-CoA hydrolase/transferase C-terminal domain-containing protein [Pseudomonadota bacterium]